MTEEQELELFAIKSKFFREIPHPKLILKAVNQVERMLDRAPIIPGFTVETEPTDLVHVLKHHSAKLYELKLAISRSNTPEELYLALNELYEQHLFLVKKLAGYVPPMSVYPDSEIRQSQPIDSYAILQFLVTHQLPETEIKAYICGELEKAGSVSFSILTTSALQCRKILGNG